MAHLDFTLDDEIIKELLLGNREDAIKKLLEEVFNAVLNVQATQQIKAQPYERSEERLTSRNGYRDRGLQTRVGSLTLKVPKFREGNFTTELFSAYQRSEQALLMSMMEMVIQGVSTRKITDITEKLCGTSFSKSTVSNLCKDLDPVVKSFRQRPLESHYPFIIVDAIYMRARENHSVKPKGLLIAIGINSDGYREVLGFCVADGESETSWSEFFEHLKGRGLKNVDHVTSDSHGGLVNAIRKHFNQASWQRCQTHFSKNMLDKTPKKHQPEMKNALSDMYNAPDLENAARRKEQIMTHFANTAPKAVNLLDESFDDVTAIFRFPESYRKRLRTSNNIERLNEELRRRERVIRIFPNEDSLTRLIGAVLIEQHEKWLSGRKYFCMNEYYNTITTTSTVQVDRSKQNQASRSSPSRVA